MKRLICCLDGTWNHDRGDAPLTNVAKLHRAVAPVDDHGVTQTSRYVAGIASSPGEIAAFLKGATGFEIAARIREAYERLALDYAPGDELYLFGFSRGAFEARSLGAFIALFGMARPESTFSFDDAWNLYQQRPDARSPEAMAHLRRGAHFPIRIQGMGVWDTVGNIGNPFSPDGLVSNLFDFHDTRLSDAIDVGLHALSIDEKRGPFRPTLWTLPKGRKPAANQHIEQVWFAGSHADVGGGYAETDLSDIALIWMAERMGEKTSLRFDMDHLRATTSPNPLGAQHASTTGRIFFWSGVLPFVRLIQQKPDGISRLRRAIFGGWRTGRAAEGEVPVNESVHESAIARRGMRVVEIHDDVGRLVTYKPLNLQAALADGKAVAALRERDVSAGKRVKIYTVHGTFAHAAEWDNWSEAASPEVATTPRFINRLSKELADQHGVILSREDHTQYNWSGGNSHDERRTSAIGLKKFIQHDLEAIDADCRSSKNLKGYRDYYTGGVFVIGHSHGGTISRMAMNLWDSKDEFFDPKGRATDELKHDDTCPICMRTRNGDVGPNTFPRPDGVVTFGSPFVHFTERKSGLAAMRLLAWAIVILGLVGVVAYYAWPLVARMLNMAGMPGPENAETFGFYPGIGPVDAFLQRPGVQAVMQVVAPLVAFWLLALYIPRSLLNTFSRFSGTASGIYFLARVISHAIAAAGLIALATYYFVYFRGGGWTGHAGWAEVVARFPVFAERSTFQTFWLLFPLVAYWLLAISLPSRLLSLMRRKVDRLRGDLPKKYDPKEPFTRPTPYLAYSTFGDEAGAGLNFFSGLTWLVQTLTLTASMVLIVGLIAAAFMIVEMVTSSPQSGSGGVLSLIGLSPTQNTSNFIWVMDQLTRYPVRVLNWVMPAADGSAAFHNLGDLGDRAVATAGWVPWNLVVVVGTMLLFAMPAILVAIALTYLVSMWLRGSGLVFGGERFTWTMANHITASRRPGPNTKLKRVNIAPEAWRKGLMAHCYFYESDAVIKDLAAHLAHWRDFQADSALRPGRILSVGARWMVVMFFVLSLFAFAVQNAIPDANPKPRPAAATTPARSLPPNDTRPARAAASTPTETPPPTEPVK